ncbi:Gmad2 immunoglobulin-like domain-containing protein [Kribbella sp. NBC_00889]|uniref:Gmad2 immunoglobulin-like domain-containing protein n=1 Tax=Kribbella sp. NBC_00889 TaxID=2975974 RepID=UPI00386F2E86|nr:GerMN domain-containing protein [Kribbella sp. NBC_00889]
MNEQPNDSFDELMRRSLHEEADRVEPTDSLPEIQARARAQRRTTSRRPWVLTAGAAIVGTAAVIGAFTVLDNNMNTAGDSGLAAGPSTSTSASALPSSTTPQSSTSPSQPPPEPPTAQATSVPKDRRGTPEPMVKGTLVPVYWLGDKTAVRPTPGATTKATPRVRLYRTWAKVSGRPAVEAVRIMTSKQPGDPDYYSVWRGAEINTVTRSDGTVTVDFKRLPTTKLDPETADVAAQQLIYTVQGALDDSSQQVQITQDGQVGARLFGQVDTSTPLSRAQAANVQALVWITSPAQDQLTKSMVTVEGTAAAYEATVNYEATNLKTREVRKGYTNTKEGQKFTPFAFNLKLTPGPWQIEAFLISPADGSTTDIDSKTIEVR